MAETLETDKEAVFHKRFLRTKSLYEQAADANLADRFRKGALIELPAEGDLIVSGDLHGNLDNFNRVLEMASLDTHPARHLVVQEVTHVLEPGPDHSFEVQESLAAMKIRYPHQLHVLMGNHEHAEVVGEEILKGGICLNIVFRETMRKSYGSYTDQVHELMCKFIGTMPLALRTANRLFCSHSTPDLDYAENFSLDFFRERGSDIREDGDMVYKLLWSRDYSQEAANTFAGLVDADVLIVGHTACKKGFRFPNQTHVIIDSKDHMGCVLYIDLDRPYAPKDLERALRRIVKP